jgi:hypothetical protein
MGLFGREISFKPDGFYNRIPYRAVDEGGVDAVIGGRIERFSSIEAFIAASTSAQNPFSSPVPTRKSSGSTSPAPLASDPFASASPQPSRRPKRGTGWLIVVVLIIVGLFWIGRDPSGTATTEAPSTAYRASSPISSSSQRIVDVINDQFGGVCVAKLEGFFSNTLRLDWTASTTKLHTITIFAAIGSTKETLYESGIRYLKFPNDAGGYNIIDWKTGEKSSVSERARYYFP